MTVVVRVNGSGWVVAAYLQPLDLQKLENAVVIFGVHLCVKKA